MSFDSFLKNLNNKYENPFNTVGFLLAGEETYGLGHSVHRIGNRVLRLFDEEGLTLVFRPKDLNLGLAVLVRTACDPYGIASNSFMINGIFFKSDNLLFNEIQIFKQFFDFVSGIDAGLISIRITYPTVSSLNYSKQILMYVIDRDHLDSFYRDEELLR